MRQQYLACDSKIVISMHFSSCPYPSGSLPPFSKYSAHISGLGAPLESCTPDSLVRFPSSPPRMTLLSLEVCCSHMGWVPCSEGTMLPP